MSVLLQYISVKRRNDEIEFTCHLPYKISTPARVAYINKTACNDMREFDNQAGNIDAQHTPSD